MASWRPGHLAFLIHLSLAVWTDGSLWGLRHVTDSTKSPLTTPSTSQGQPKSSFIPGPVNKVMVTPSAEEQNGKEEINATRENEIVIGRRTGLQVIWKCDNENHQCLRNTGMAMFSWNTTSGSGLPGNPYRPEEDVTYGNSTGRYRYAEKDNTTRLLTVAMETEGIILHNRKNVCLDFSYYIDGSHESSHESSSNYLLVILRRDVKSRPIWESDGILSPGWRRGQVNLSLTFGTLHFQFLYMSKGQGVTVAAVDHVTLSQGKCLRSKDAHQKNTESADTGSWGPCSVSFGLGIRRRKIQGGKCEDEVKLCTAQTADWSTWTTCSASCGPGYRSRERLDKHRETAICYLTPCIGSQQQHQGSPSSADQTSCGRRTIDQSLHNILGGQVSTPHSWPWLVVILYHGSIFCGGSIISQRYIVTAAHCFSNKNLSDESLTVRIGAHWLSDGVLYKIKREVPHPQYDPERLTHDIALVETTRDIEFSNGVSPICLPEREPDSSSKCYATGWGATAYPSGPKSPVLREVRLNIIDRDLCRSEASHISHAHICTGEDAHRAGVYAGDSGGPLACIYRGRYYLAGVTSHSSHMKISDFFTNVVQYRDWIRRKIGLPK